MREKRHSVIFQNQARSFYNGAVAGAPEKIQATKIVQKYVDYAWQISKDAQFIFMLEGENERWTPDRQSDVYMQLIDEEAVVCNNANWTENCRREDSWGFCQTHRHYHPEIVNDKRFFTDWRWQMRQCKTLWDKNTTFYGYKNNLHKSITKFR